jgi:hypothetical protein
MRRQSCVAAARVWLIMSLAAAGCGGGSGPHDAGGKDAHDGAADAAMTDAGSGTDVAEAATDAQPGDGAADGDDGQANDVSPAGDASDASDTPPPDAPSDAGDGGDAEGGSSDAAAATLTVVAAQNVLPLDACHVTPALLADIPAGTYTIQLAASTLSKGSVSGTPQLPAVDNYVVVHVPLDPGDPQEARRFFMLNGIGASASVKLATPGTIEVMFIDTDTAYNSGQATVTLNPGGYSTTVDAAANVLAWQEACAATPATLSVSDVPHRVTLTATTLSTGTGSDDPFVVLRLPSELPTDDHRFVILNGVGASYDFTPYNSQTVRGWFISTGGDATGEATLKVTDL